jgi:hypothetical protein
MLKAFIAVGKPLMKILKALIFSVCEHLPQELSILGQSVSRVSDYDHAKAPD